MYIYAQKESQVCDSNNKEMRETITNIPRLEIGTHGRGNKRKVLTAIRLQIGRAGAYLPLIYHASMYNFPYLP